MNKIKLRLRNPNQSQTGSSSDMAARPNQGVEHTFVPLIHKMQYYEHQNPFAMKSSKEYRLEFEKDYLKEKMSRNMYMQMVKQAVKKSIADSIDNQSNIEDKILKEYSEKSQGKTISSDVYPKKIKLIDNPMLEMVESNYKKFKKLVPETPNPPIKILAASIMKDTGIKLEIPDGATDLDYIDKRLENTEQKLRQIDIQKQANNAHLKDQIDEILQSSSSDDSYKFIGDNSYIPGHKDGVDLKKKKNELYNGPIDPKDQSNFEDYFNSIQHTS